MAYSNTAALMNAMIAPGVPKDVLQVLSKNSGVAMIEEIIKTVHDLSFTELRVRKRRDVFVRGRCQAIYLVYIYTELSYEDCARLFKPAIKDHSSAIWSMQRIDKALKDRGVVRHPFILEGFDKCMELAAGMIAMKAKDTKLWRLKSDI